jgi:AcrR family transcriptional regulator
MNAPARRTRTDAAANRQRILDTARAVFVRKGFAAEVREIANEAGVGFGTIYRNFGSRDGLIEAVLADCRAEVMPTLLSLVESKDPAAGFREMLRTGARSGERWGVFAEAVLSGQMDKQEVHYEQVIGPLSALLQRGVDQGVFRKDLDIPAVVTVAESLYHGRSFLDFARQRSFVEAADAIADVLLCGMVDR